jgi:hypothetical protein
MPANKEIPLDIQKGFKVMLEECKKLADTYYDTVSFTFDTDHFTIEFNDRHQPSKFFMRIVNPGKTEGKGVPLELQASFVRYPRSEGRLEDYSERVPMNHMPNHVKGWISIVDSFNTFSLESDSTIEKHYSDNFYEELKSADEDADVKPFDDEKQIYLVKFLEYIENQTADESKNNSEVAQINLEAKTLKTNISRSAKNNVLKGLSKLGAKIKMQGPDFAKSLFKTAKDETIKFILKELLTGGWYSITNLLHN